MVVLRAGLWRGGKQQHTFHFIANLIVWSAIVALISRTTLVVAATSSNEALEESERDHDHDFDDDDHDFLHEDLDEERNEVALSLHNLGFYRQVAGEIAQSEERHYEDNNEEQVEKCFGKHLDFATLEDQLINIYEDETDFGSVRFQFHYHCWDTMNEKLLNVSMRLILNADTYGDADMSNFVLDPLHLFTMNPVAGHWNLKFYLNTDFEEFVKSYWYESKDEL